MREPSGPAGTGSAPGRCVACTKLTAANPPTRASPRPASISRLYAFHYDGPQKGVPATDPSGWGMYDHAVELARMGLPNAQFRLTSTNEEHSLCGTYPSRLVVPSSIEDESLSDIAKYRQGNRLPVLAYLHPKTKAPLFVAGQPLTGSAGGRCYDDERMFRAILEASPSPDKPGYIIDLRSASEATAQKGKGLSLIHI